MGCDQVRKHVYLSADISIHASRMGCDVRQTLNTTRTTNFNPRIPYGMRRFAGVNEIHVTYFNPRIPYGMRRSLGFLIHRLDAISIHASRMGCDELWPHRLGSMPYFNPRIPYGMRRGPSTRMTTSNYFNPRIPYGMRPDLWTVRQAVLLISIHASRMGCDLSARLQRRKCQHFNPRIPYGMRPILVHALLKFVQFQSTHPVWDATVRWEDVHD